MHAVEVFLVYQLAVVAVALRHAELVRLILRPRMYGHGYDVHIAQTAQLLDVYGAYETDTDNANAEPLHYAKHSFFHSGDTAPIC